MRILMMLHRQISDYNMGTCLLTLSKYHNSPGIRRK
uniref:Uncharacterized protein n=1 Tax=Manihot esculenta TaxID=3983 RepID=A0A2C9WN08_MANES